MNASGIFKYSDIKPEDITFSPPKTNANGGQTVYINHVSGHPLTIQVPRTRCPFGLSKNEFDGVQKCSIDISFGLSEDSKIWDFKEWIMSIDTLMKTKAKENSVQWFKKDYTSVVLEELYRHQITKSKKAEYADTMKFKITNTREGKPNLDVFDNKRNLIEPERITKGTDVMIIAQLSSIWFVNKMFGVTWRVKQVKAWPRVTLKSYAFEDESDNDESSLISDELSD